MGSASTRGHIAATGSLFVRECLCLPLCWLLARQEGTAVGVSSQRSHRSEKRDMTDIYIELGGKKAIAWSLEWPGWCRIRTSEETALQALIDAAARYRLIAHRAKLDFAPGDPGVFETLPGAANTPYRVPPFLSSSSTPPIH